jgi:hypothetical protein
MKRPVPVSVLLFGIAAAGECLHKIAPPPRRCTKWSIRILERELPIPTAGWKARTPRVAVVFKQSG